MSPNVWVPPNDRARLEQLCRYLRRPPVAQHRVQLRPDGGVLVKLKTVWPPGCSPQHRTLAHQFHALDRIALARDIQLTLDVMWKLADTRHARREVARG